MTSDDVQAAPGDNGGGPAPRQDQIDGIVAQVIGDHIVGNDGDPIHLLTQRLAETGIELDDSERAAVEQRVRDSL